MPALVLLPPLPPEEVARGQQCFGWFFRDITFVARLVIPRKKPKRRRRVTGKRKNNDPRQRTLDLPRHWRQHTPPATQLRKKEREQMEKDVRWLMRRGVYNTRPRHGNGFDGDCRPGTCPWISCRHHLFLTVMPKGRVKLNFPGKDVDQIGETCSLRVAGVRSPDDDPMPFDEVATYMNETEGRTVQVALVALNKIKRGGALVALRQEG